VTSNKSTNKTASKTTAAKGGSSGKKKNLNTKL
jgi:hypothetical protein